MIARWRWNPVTEKHLALAIEQRNTNTGAVRQIGHFCLLVEFIEGAYRGGGGDNFKTTGFG